MPRYVVYNRPAPPNLIACFVAHPAKLSLWHIKKDNLNQYEVTLSVDGLVHSTEVVFGKNVALRRYQERLPDVAVIVAKIALGLPWANEKTV